MLCNPFITRQDYFISIVCKARTRRRAIVNDNMICKTNSTSRHLLNFAETNNINIINSNQGYSKCSICIVSENAIITEDSGIERLLKKYY